MKNKYMTETDIVGIKESRKRKKKNISADKSFVSMESMEELLKRDEQREKDGFAKKIKIGKVMAGPGKVIMIPYVTEEKIIHGDFEPSEDGDEGDAGKGDGEVGEVIGKKPLWGEGEDGDKGEESNGAGEGSGGEHGIEAEAYKQGKELSEKFQLPNLKEKGKKVPTDEYIYDLTDRHRGSGQLLDKKATLKSIVKTNMVLGKLDKDNVDTTKLVVGPNDRVYRVLSKERVWKSRAVVFFAMIPRRGKFPSKITSAWLPAAALSSPRFIKKLPRPLKAKTLPRITISMFSRALTAMTGMTDKEG